jgi:hypothetical protein
VPIRFLSVAEIRIIEVLTMSHNGGKGFKGSRVQVKIKSVHSFSSPSPLHALRSPLSAHPPMDQAKGILAYIQARHPDKGYDVDGVMSELLVYDRRPEDQFIEVRETVSRIVEISGKSIRTLLRTISLLKNPDEIQTAIQRQIDAIYRQIDRLAYELYGLTEEEIKIVENPEA